MNILATHTLTGAQKQAVYSLWNNEYPRQLAYRDMDGLDSYLGNLEKQRHYFAVNEGDRILGWAFVFERENEKWFAIIIDSSAHGKGIGTSLLNRLKEDEKVLNGWATDHDNYRLRNGAPYPSPVAFYLKNDFVVCPETRLDIDILSAVKIRWEDLSPALSKREGEVE